MSASCQVEMSPFCGSKARLESPFGAAEAGHVRHTKGDDDDARTRPAEVRARGCRPATETLSGRCEAGSDDTSGAPPGAALPTGRSSGSDFQAPEPAE